MNSSLFILGAATNIVGAGYSAPPGFLIASNNAHPCAVYLGDAQFPNGGITLAATVTNHVADGEGGFVNSGTMTIGGQNTSGTNTYANPIILGWTPNRGKSVTLVAATGGTVDFTGGLRRNGTDATAGVTVGDATHAGVIRLSAANTFVGVTRVNAGTLLVNGALASGAVVVAGGALGGTGSIHGPVTVESGGAFAPGASIGTLTISNTLTLAAGSHTLVEVDAGSGSSDLVTGLSNVSYDGTLVVSNLTGAVTAGRSFLLVRTAAASGNFAAIRPASPGAGLAWSFNPSNGLLTALTTVALNPTNIAAHLRGTDLTITWPADHLGWTLQSQTNNLDYGVSGDANDWMRLSDSVTTNWFTLRLDTNQTVGFYRLVYP